MRYKYMASTASGQAVGGTIDASEEAAAEKALNEAGYRLLTLKPLKSHPSLEKLFPSLFGVKSGEVIALSRQLATLLESGIDMVAAVEILSQQASSKPAAKMFSQIAESLRGGSTLGTALGQYPAVFPTTYRRMVEVGEQTGAPDEALRQAAMCLDKQRQSAKKVQAALVYPAMVTGMAVLVAIVLVVAVLPPMVEMFVSLNAELPLPTRVLIGSSSFINAHFIEMLLAAAGGTGFLVFFLRRPNGRRQLDRLLLRLPLMGRILLYSDLSRFARTMSTLLKSGIAMSESIELATGSCKNRIICEALANATRELLQGEGLSAPLSRAKLFPPLLVQMVRVGEETGHLDSNLAAVADSYEAETGERTQALIATMEPTLTLAIAVVVGFIAISVVMPMYSMLGSIE